MEVDLNSDVGESFGAWTSGDDKALIPLVTSVNVACGFHAGDPLVIERTVAVAVRSGASVGAHPGYPDLAGFGRREMEMTPAELEAAVVYQVGAVGAFVRAAGAELRHVKPHGALYNRAAVDASVADSIAHAVRRVSRDLILVGLAGSVMLEAGRAAGLRVAAEAFADRAYEPDGHLRSRGLPDAVHASPAVAAAQAVSIVRDGRATAHDGSTVVIRADTICIHGDTPHAPEFARAIRSALTEAGLTIAALRAS